MLNAAEEMDSCRAFNARARYQMQGGIEMRRRTFDALMVVAGLALTAILVVAGVLLLWGNSFANSQVRSQLAAQKIVFPTTSNAEFKALPKSDQAAMKVYAGQEMLTGAQAQTYADHFIAVHLQEMTGGKTYAQLSAESLADPSNTALAKTVQTVFQGQTLRGTLLTAYAFWMFGVIALWSAVAMFILAILMLILTILGWRHYRYIDPAVEI
jgi:hypothetical protein